MLADAAADAATPVRDLLADAERDTAVAVTEALRDREALTLREDVNERLANAEGSWLLPKVTLAEALAAADALGERLREREDEADLVTVGLKPV
jgi:hypothetical protein